MENRAVVLQEIRRARGALELAPGAAIGMAIGAQITPPEPAAITTARVGTEVLRGVHCAGTAVGWGHRLGWRRRRWLGMRGFSLTEGTMGRGGQARKRFGFSGVLASGGLRWRDRLAPDGGVQSQPAEHEEEPYQSDEPECVEKEGWYHGNAPTDSGEMRAL
jgi:hypothetical protein